MRSKLSNNEVLAIGCSGLLYIAIRIQELGGPITNLDEVFTLWAVRGDWHRVWAMIIPDRVHPPLYYAVLKQWLGLFGSSNLSAQMLSVTCACLAVIPIRAVARRMQIGGFGQAMLIALMAVNPFLVLYARQVRMYALILLLASLSMWAWIRVVERPGSTIRWIVYLVIAVALVWTQYFGWCLLAVEYLSSVLWVRKIVWKLTLTGAATLASFSPWLYILSLPHRTTGSVAWIVKPTIADPLMLLSWSVITIDLPHTMAVVFMFGFLLPVSWLLRFRPVGYLTGFLLASVIVPIAVMFSVSHVADVSVWAPRHLIGIVPPTLIMSVAGLSGILGKHVHLVTGRRAAPLIHAEPLDEPPDVTA